MEKAGRMALAGILSLLLFTPLAMGSQLSQEIGGRYFENPQVMGYSYKENAPRYAYQVIIRGGEMYINDRRRDLQYRLNLSKPTSLPQSYMDYYKAKPGYDGIYQMVPEATVSQFKVFDNGKKFETTLTYTIAYHNDEFGTIDGSIKVDVEGNFSKRCHRFYNFLKMSYQTGDCLSFSTRNVRLASLKTSLGGNVDRILSLFLDFGLKLAAPGFRLGDRTFYKKKQ